ncbi:MAG: hypothetical protein ABSE83_11690 [Methanobacterium sp.]
MKIVHKNAEIKIDIHEKYGVLFWNPFNKEWVDKPRDVVSCCGYGKEEKVEAMKEMIYFLETQNKLWKI